MFQNVKPPQSQAPSTKLRKLWGKLLAEYDYRAEELSKGTR